MIYDNEITELALALAEVGPDEFPYAYYEDLAERIVEDRRRILHKNTVWGLPKYGALREINSGEHAAAELAEHYPETIYFFAELAPKEV